MEVVQVGKNNSFVSILSFLILSGSHFSSVSCNLLHLEYSKSNPLCGGGGKDIKCHGMSGQ